MCLHLNLRAGVVRPYVVWEAGSGRVVVDRGLAGRLWGASGHVTTTTTTVTAGHTRPFGRAGADSESQPAPGEVVGTMSVMMAQGLFRHLAAALPQVRPNLRWAEQRWLGYYSAEHGYSAESE